MKKRLACIVSCSILNNDKVEYTTCNDIFETQILMC